MTDFRKLILIGLVTTLSGLGTANADEHLFGYVRGAEPQPQGTWEFYQIVTQRSDKGKGRYGAWDTETELEYGFSDRFAAVVSLDSQHRHE